MKALAKLSHPGIVRYHQSWFESVPLGWLKEYDDSLREAGISGLNAAEDGLSDYTTTAATTTTAAERRRGSLSTGYQRGRSYDEDASYSEGNGSEEIQDSDGKSVSLILDSS